MRLFLLTLVLLIPLAEAETPIRHAFLAADPRAFRVAMIDETGAVGWTFAAPHTCDAFVLPDHRVLISDQRVDPVGKVVWEVTELDLPGHPLRFVGQVQRLPNGHTLICNWPAHGHEGKQPLLVEVTGAKQVAWVFDGRDRLRGIIGLQLLDDIKVRP